jgi:hypothetical protein
MADQPSKSPRSRRSKRGTATSDKVAIAALSEQGLSTADISKALAIPKSTVKEVVEEASLIVEANAAEYARIHMVAAKNAAEKGRAEPAQWALERLGVVQPAPAPQAPQGSGGPVIKIGILLPGLSQETARQQIAVDAHVEEVPEVAR